MNDDRDPLIADALRRLASGAPQPRADRLQAVVEGVHRRRQLRMTTSALTAAAFVVAAAVGVHIWTTPASDTTVGPGPTLPPISASPDPAVSSAPASLSPIASASAPAPVIAVTPTSKPTIAAKGLVVTVTTPASVIDGDPAKVTMTVTNKGSVTTHGGSFTVVNAYATAGGTETGFEFSGYTTSCQSVGGALVCDLAVLKPGQSAQFWQAITATGPADQIVFEVKWTSNTGASTTYHRVVRVVAGVPSSEVSTPPSSVLPTPPSSSPPPASGSPSTSPSSPKASSS
jgi:hypothetical protein